MLSASLVLLVSVPLFTFYVLYRRGRGSLKHLRGPPVPSWLFGNQRQLRFQADVGDLEFEWVREYGEVMRTGGCWGIDQLLVADPRALQYILQGGGYHYPKRAEMNESTRHLMGRGLVWASGSVHQRQRRILNPVFTAQQLRTFLPQFQQCASRLTQKWKEQIENGNTTLNVSRWLPRLTLDAIGDAAFDYHFGALDDPDGKNELLECLDNLFADSTLYPSKFDMLFRALWDHIPESVLKCFEYLPNKEIHRFRSFKVLAKRVAAQLVREKTTSALASEATSRDVMSVLVRSNTAQEGKRMLDEDEVLSQMATLLLGGHETIASTLGWLLYELAKHPEQQQTIREEIKALRMKVGSDAEFSVAELDSLPFTNAAIKESLRLHPISPTINRIADRDDVIPLSTPIVGTNGDQISEVAIAKGQEIMVSICSYNRLTSVWGADAHEWNPKRFLEDRDEKSSAQAKNTSVGVFSNLLTFAAGVRGCIGWRFAMIEMQAVLVELMDNFELRIPEGGLDIQRLPAGMMIPMIRGKMHEGVQMPLQISIVE
ncbi:hypothetical protein HGRIS_007785 [Hohenbuehelia grisea]|uniref:Cytochrome P450 n=1 Tax=Hohenbuehelia grisea TaxID=104357 RepID=A0ABR3J6D9_9AGAR